MVTAWSITGPATPMQAQSTTAACSARKAASRSSKLAKPLLCTVCWASGRPAGAKSPSAVLVAPISAASSRGSRSAAAFAGSEGVTSIRKIETPNLETRKLALPAWRVEFADDQHTTLFVSARTGEVLGLRNDTWRLWDVFWMIHIMDYTERESFNHPLIVTVATGVAWLALSGLILLFRAFRRSDFAWIVDPWERMRRR